MCLIVGLLIRAPAAGYSSFRTTGQLRGLFCKMQQTPERLVYGLRIRKGLRDVGVKNDDIGAFRIRSKILAAHTFAEIVAPIFRTKLIRPLSLLHRFSSPHQSLGAH